MPLARIAGSVLFFVHVPKTGGTSVEAYLRAKGATLALHGQAAEWSRAPLQHLHRAAYAEAVPPGCYDHGFAIVRDPMARLVSEFRMRAEPMAAKLRPVGWLSAARNRARGRATWGLRIDRRLEFHDFDGWVARVLDAAARDPWLLSNHVRPQAEFVDPAHRLFRFEDGLAPVFRWIDATTGTPPAEGGFHERRSPPIEVVWSAETEARARAFYAADYALLAGLAP